MYVCVCMEYMPLPLGRCCCCCNRNYTLIVYAFLWLLVLSASMLCICCCVFLQADGKYEWTVVNLFACGRMINYLPERLYFWVIFCMPYLLGDCDWVARKSLAAKSSRLWLLGKHACTHIKQMVVFNHNYSSIHTQINYVNHRN